MRIPREMELGSRDEFILARWLYKALIEETALANDEKWMSKIN